MLFNIAPHDHQLDRRKFSRTNHPEKTLPWQMPTKQIDALETDLIARAIRQGNLAGVRPNWRLTRTSSTADFDFDHITDMVEESFLRCDDTVDGWKIERL